MCVSHTQNDMKILRNKNVFLQFVFAISVKLPSKQDFRFFSCFKSWATYVLYFEGRRDTPVTRSGD